MRRLRRNIRLILPVAVIALAMACTPKALRADRAQSVSVEVNAALRPVIESALAQTEQTTIYDPAYVRLAYPGGDLPIERGVCADVIVRAFRKGGVELQKEVHEDMGRAFAAYQPLGAESARREHRPPPRPQ